MPYSHNIYKIVVQGAYNEFFHQNCSIKTKGTGYCLCARCVGSHTAGAFYNTYNLGHPENAEASLGTFSPGVYTTSVTLSGNTMELAVTVDSDIVKSIRLVNTSETVETMYPLISSSLEALEKQVREKGSTDGITYSADAKYTSLVLINAIDTALDKAKK